MRCAYVAPGRARSATRRGMATRAIARDVPQFGLNLICYPASNELRGSPDAVARLRPKDEFAQFYGLWAESESVVKGCQEETTIWVIELMLPGIDQEHVAPIHALGST